MNNNLPPIFSEILSTFFPEQEITCEIHKDCVEPCYKCKELDSGEEQYNQKHQE